MDIGKIAQKRMIDKDIGVIELAEKTGLSKPKCYRLIKNDKSLRLKDVEIALNYLEIDLKAVIRGWFTTRYYFIFHTSI